MTALTATFESMPEVLAREGMQRWQALCEAAGDNSWYREVAEDTELGPQLAVLLACSHAAAELCQRYPQWLPEIAAMLSEAAVPEQWSAALPAFATEQSEEQVDRALREFRNRSWLRIVWRDINRLTDTAGTTAELTALAELCLQRALDYHYQRLCREWGEPVSIGGEPQQLVVLAMGKLGAGELNLSSDIDLVFTYAEDGETRGGPKSVDNQQFFVRLGQRLIKTLDQLTADGFVFRVDMRLRPYGDSGPLVMSFDALEEYYQDQGREWERYAMLKARCVAGDRVAGEQLLVRLRPFVYRRYVDFSVIDALRDLKSRIQREVKRRNLEGNIKLGPGGIRELEFVAQCIQLIRGGRDTDLQQRSLARALDEIEKLEFLPPGAVPELRAANRFLRDAEHALQAWQDRQTQNLPDAPLPCAALAWAMGCEGDWERFRDVLGEHRERVTEHFNNIIASPEPEDDGHREGMHRWRAVLEELDAENARRALAEAGHEDPAEAGRRLLTLLGSNGVSRMQKVGRERLYDFLPRLLEALGDAERPTRTLLRVMPLVEAVLRRTAYLVLLVENPGALARLVRLCDASPWISRQLAAHPVLLDELLDPRTLYNLPDKSGLRSELREQLLRLDAGDLEGHMEALRYYKLAHVLRVAACEVTEVLPLMQVSDYLTCIAEVILESVLEIAWRDLVARHGEPANGEGRQFIVLGYGKLGGIELNYGSDLDLVFVHGGEQGASTDGERPLDTTVFYTRLGQRMIHILTTQTRLGKLYEADMRLRPSGNSGLLVASFTAYREYQYKQAWTWEHQALVRARVVAGDETLAEHFQALRTEVLGQSREGTRLLEDVRQMRQRMREHLLSATAGDEDAPEFDLKQSPGGIVDIEFVVQYAVLAWSRQYPPLAVYTDNIRILESLQREGLLEEADVQALVAAYKTFRSHAHRLSLQEEKGLVPRAEVGEHPDEVLRIWRKVVER